MHRISLKSLNIALCLALAAAAALVPAHADSVRLNAVEFPEKRPVELPFSATKIAPAAELAAEVNYRKGQARIDLSFEEMKPAILFGGDVTCFVVWAVTRDNQIENLGELVTRKQSGKLNFSTGKKSFALMVTAEPFYLVSRPSELVVFYNRQSVASQAETRRFLFEDFAEAPEHHVDGIAHLLWDSKVPLELLQARKAHELAERIDAQKYAKQVYVEAGAFLRSADELASSAPKSRELIDFARRAVTLSNEALNIATHRIEAAELEKKNAARRAETEALERQAAEARILAEEFRTEQERMTADTLSLREEKLRLEKTMVALRQERASMEREKMALEDEAARAQREKAELNQRLQAALSHVADTQGSARGFVINLPDILFNVDQDTLRPEAQVVLSKLAGILLMMPNQGAIVEGHTDATGDAYYNLELSRRRARSVTSFLQVQGVEAKRLEALGFGIEQPVADNTTIEGRRKNRRVEIVISQTSGSATSNN